MKGGTFEVLDFQNNFDYEYITGEVFQINYELTDASLTKLSLDRITSSFIINSTDGELFVSFPKAIPLHIQEGLDYPVFVAVLDGAGRYAPLLEPPAKVIQTAQDCTFDLKIEFNNEIEKEIQVNINHGHVIAAPLTYVDLPVNCLEKDPRNDTEIQRKLNDKQCTDSNYNKGFNIRDEVVCVSPESYPWLNQRGYMKTFPIIK